MHHAHAHDRALTLFGSAGSGVSGVLAYLQGQNLVAHVGAVGSIATPLGVALIRALFTRAEEARLRAELHLERERRVRAEEQRDHYFDTLTDRIARGPGPQETPKC